MCNFLLLKRHKCVSEPAPQVNSALRSPAANLGGGVGAAGCIRDQPPADLSPLPWVSKQPRGGGGKRGLLVGVELPGSSVSVPAYFNHQGEP